MPMSTEPQTLVEAVRHFADPEVTHKTIVELRWVNGVHCPTCGRVDVRYISTRRMWECKEKHAKKQFSSKIGTIFEDSPLSLDKWFVAIWMIANCKNGVSSYELARAIGVTQKTSWFMLHRIRLAMQTGSFIKRSSRAAVPALNLRPTKHSSAASPRICPLPAAPNPSPAAVLLASRSLWVF